MADPMQLLPELRAMGFEVTESEGRVGVRLDVEEAGDPGEQHDRIWDRYCELCESLAEIGLCFSARSLEHDCISGEVVAFVSCP